MNLKALNDLWNLLEKRSVHSVLMEQEKSTSEC